MSRGIIPRSTAKRFVENYLDSDEINLPPWWVDHIAGEECEDLCVFCKKPHNSTTVITYFHDPGVTGRRDLEAGNILFYLCADEFAYMNEYRQKYNESIEKNDLLSRQSAELKDEIDRVRQSMKNKTLDYDSLGIGGGRPRDHALGEDDDYADYKMNQDYKSRRIYDFVNTGLIPDVDDYLITGSRYRRCFICDDSPYDSNELENWTRIQIPVGQSDYITGKVVCCHDCHADIEEEIIQTDPSDVGYEVVKETCINCGDPYSITKQERSFRDTTTNNTVGKHSCNQCLNKYEGRPRLIQGIPCSSCGKTVTSIDLTLVNHYSFSFFNKYSDLADLSVPLEISQKATVLLCVTLKIPCLSNTDSYCEDDPDLQNTKDMAKKDSVSTEIIKRTRYFDEEYNVSIEIAETKCERKNKCFIFTVRKKLESVERKRIPLSALAYSFSSNTDQCMEEGNENCEKCKCADSFLESASLLGRNLAQNLSEKRQKEDKKD